MPLTPPNLDDRDFDALLELARQHMSERHLERWNDLSASDPGIILLELFAYLTDVMIYRLNRVPDKIYIALLNLIGVHLQPPAAASVILEFSRPTADANKIEIPRGTRVTTIGGSTESPVFITAEPVTIAPRTTSVQVQAYHAEWIEGELLEFQTDAGAKLPHNSVTVLRPPIIAPTTDGLDLLVGVEVKRSDPKDADATIRRHRLGPRNIVPFRIWHEVENFTDVEGADRRVYTIDRMTGTITFAPSIRSMGPDGQLEAEPHPMADVPPTDRQLRVWYRRGGGANGNVSAGSLTVLKDPIPGLSVTNPEPAIGGADGETLENALIRGPQELNTLERVVTARDFERAVLERTGSFARAKALTRAQWWPFATPGSVEIIVAPHIPAEAMPQGRLTIENLRAAQHERELEELRLMLQRRTPLGITTLVSWANYKVITIRASIVVAREEAPERLRERILTRLHYLINPLPTWPDDLTVNRPLTQALSVGWPFGRSLFASDIYEIVLEEPGVRWVEDIRIAVDEAPSADVRSLRKDHHMPNTWFAGVHRGDHNVIFRSFNNGVGWENIHHISDGELVLLELNPYVPGLLAAVTRIIQEDAITSTIHISTDSGENWDSGIVQVDFEIEDLAWTNREDQTLLLMATDQGLFELPLGNLSIAKVEVDIAQPNLGFYAVETIRERRGVTTVALAAQNLQGVYLSSLNGESGTFRHVGLRDNDVRILSVQRQGSRAFLWAGTATPGGDSVGSGCFRWELREAEDDPYGWRAFNRGWVGGSCLGIAFQGERIFAGTYGAGVIYLDTDTTDRQWIQTEVVNGLPLAAAGRFVRVSALDINPNTGMILSGGPQGIYASQDQGQTYRLSSRSVYTDKVTLPQNWLFVSGNHEIDVVIEDAARRD